KLGSKYQYIGIDLSEDQIEWNKEYYKNNQKLRFYHGEAGNIKSIHSEPNTLFLTFVTLSCFTQVELDDWLFKTKPTSGKNAVSIAEWIIDYDYEKETESVPMSPTLYNHNYVVRLQKIGMQLHKLE